MTAMVALWWVWAVAGIGFLMLEVLIPGFIFLGFGVGAAIVSALLFFGIMGTSLSILILVFAVISLIAWFAMREMMGVRKGQVKKWDRDINDDP